LSAAATGAPSNTEQLVGSCGMRQRSNANTCSRPSAYGGKEQEGAGRGCLGDAVLPREEAPRDVGSGSAHLRAVAAALQLLHLQHTPRHSRSTLN